MKTVFGIQTCVHVRERELPIHNFNLLINRARFLVIATFLLYKTIGGVIDQMDSPVTSSKCHNLKNNTCCNNNSNNNHDDLIKCLLL